MDNKKIEQYIGDNVVIDVWSNSYIWGCKKGSTNQKMIAQFKWNEINPEDREKTLETIGIFIASAINDKLNQTTTAVTTEEIKNFLGEKVESNEDSSELLLSKDGSPNIRLIIRGWGIIQYMFDTEDKAIEFHKSVCVWIADAINLKLKQ